jgi:putative peptide maturation dehydrogenase
MPQFRRTKYLFLYCEDRQFLDIAHLLRGRAVVAPLRQILAITVLTGEEYPITRAQLDLLISIPSDKWVGRDGDDARVLRDLATHGLVLSDESDDHLLELRRRDEALSSSHWNIYAALYHFLTRWHDVDVDLPETSPPTDWVKDATAAFVRSQGRPPLHFHSVADPLAVTPLRLVERVGGLWETLARRRTTRSFAPVPLSAEEFSLVLRYTFGCRGYRQVAGGITVLSKTSPSGGALHPTEVYPLIRHVEGVEPGLYHYSAERHELELLVRLPPDEGAALATELASGQFFVRDAPALFFLTTRFYRSFWKYRRHQRAYAVLLMDAAHLAQTFYLICAELGLGAFVTAAVNGANIEERLGLDPFAEGALTMCGCGRPSDGLESDASFQPYIPRETVIE